MAGRAQPLAEWLSSAAARTALGPLAVILIEDDSAVAETIRHHLRCGFRQVLALSATPLQLGPEFAERVVNLTHDAHRPDAHVQAVSAVIAAVPEGTWLYYGFNAEFLFYPFREHRSVGELLEFHASERRDAMLCYVVDLYAGDLAAHPDAVDLATPLFDRRGYYALARLGEDGRPLERQLDFHGGLRWRFEEFLPPDRRRIDRIALFRTFRGLRLLADHRLSIAELNTYSCRWHHNLTAAIASFRVAKALMRNPGSRDSIGTMCWRNSQGFDWSSQQLLDLGLMEPGQWF